MAWKQDPNDPSKIVPDVPQYLQPTATTPPSGTVQPRPSYVIVNNTRNNSILFNFTTTGSVNSEFDCAPAGTCGSGEGEYVNFGTITGSLSKIDISPTAWSGSTGNTAGDVIFVYNDGRIPS
tara:strand:+ start:1401 stop:1766 length:366 start_codon:yes stop_codon:yes gene_type:complete